MTGPSSPVRQRIDKWLWHARVVKTRTLAQKLIDGGKVRVNRDKVHAVSTPVKTGDVVTIALRAGVRVLKIQGFAERRGSPALAQMLFEDLTARPASVQTSSSGDPNSEPAGDTNQETNDGAGPDLVHPGGAGVGRPGKRDRRKLLELKKNDKS